MTDSFAEREHKRAYGLLAPEPPKPATPAKLSIDDITRILSEIGNDEAAGPDRFRALKMLASMQEQATVIPPPLTDVEMEERLARVMYPCGAEISQRAYRLAFPKAVKSAFKNPLVDGTEEQILEAKKCTSIKLLRRRFPHSKGTGVPKGYPVGRSTAAKMVWCQEQALKMLIEEATARAKQAHEAGKAADSELRGATDGSTQSSHHQEQPEPGSGEA